MASNELINLTNMDSANLWFHECSNCLSFIRDVRFICAECFLIELCLQCYISQVELGDHMPTHAFRMMDLATFPVFETPMKTVESKHAKSKATDTEMKDDGEPTAIGGRRSSRNGKQNDHLVSKTFQYVLHVGEENILLAKPCFETVSNGAQVQPQQITRIWKAFDELKLLEAISRVGYDNWEGVKAELGDRLPGVTTQEVMEHYLVHYVLTDVGGQTFPWRMNTRQLSAIFNAYNDSSIYQEWLQEALQGVTQVQLDQLQYMPKRNDFAFEFDGQAEYETVKNIRSCSAVDDELGRKFLLANIDLYNQRLMQRLHVKAIVRKFGLVEKFFKKGNRLSLKTPAKRQIKGPRTRKTSANSMDESDFAESALNPFLRFLDQSHLQHLYLGLKREYVLKLLIRKLLQYKRHNLANLPAIRQFEADRRAIRERRKKYKKAAPAEYSDDEEGTFPLSVDNLKVLFSQPLQKEQMATIVSSLFINEESIVGDVKHKDDFDAVPRLGKDS